jgi:hypothetical protein
MRTQRALVSTVWLIIGLLLTAGEPASERIVSKFSSTARAKSISYQETGEEGDPGFHGLFPGFGGYQLEFLGGDERSWINIKFDGQTVNLYSATMQAADGTFPHKANDVVEWRGVEKNGRFTPYAIIYRIEAGNDETRKTHTRLIVIKLDRERSAVIGHAEGANEDAEAKKIADAARPHS